MYKPTLVWNCREKVKIGEKRGNGQKKENKREKRGEKGEKEKRRKRGKWGKLGKNKTI